MLIIRPETPEDITAVYHINSLAFGKTAEAELVNVLRWEKAIILSLVAVLDGQPVGHALFSPVTVETEQHVWEAVALGPVAVLPSYQQQGIGAALIRAGLEQCHSMGQSVVFVLGHSAYYPRFGFTPTHPFGIRCEFKVPDELFMVAELEPGAINGRMGIVRYHSAFRRVT